MIIVTYKSVIWPNKERESGMLPVSWFPESILIKKQTLRCCFIKDNRYYTVKHSLSGHIIYSNCPSFANTTPFLQNHIKTRACNT